MTSFDIVESIPRIRSDMRDIFINNQIIGSFICGSVLNRGCPESDIDFFICCHDTVSEQQKHEWTEYYLDLHERLGREPDATSPGELMSVDSLEYGLGRILAANPDRNIRNRYDFDYICWAGMIDSKRIDIVTQPLFTDFEVIARKAIRRWATELASGEAMTRKTGLDTDMDKILARTISCKGYYDAHE